MTLNGNPVSHGIAIGKIYVYSAFSPSVQEGYIPESERAGALARFNEVKAHAVRELAVTEALVAADDPEKAKIFRAHMDIVNDVAIAEEVDEMIASMGCTIEWAVESVFNQFKKLLSKSKDPLIAERAADLIDVKNRILRIMAGVKETNLSTLHEPVIVAAHDLLPSDTATLDRDNVLGIVTETGGATSHSAIIAKSYGIPAVLGVDALLDQIQDGAQAVLNAMSGELICAPTAAQIAQAQAQQQALADIAEIEATYLHKPCRTADGVTIDIGLNIGSHKAEEFEIADCVDLVGLFRTEFLYMGADHLPSEEAQFHAYKCALARMDGRPVTLRTLDIGGDKTLSYLPMQKEDNPFLGVRALRLCFEREDLFVTQLRAALRASVYGALWLMLPMVSGIEDIRRARNIIDTVRAQLRSEGHAVSDHLKVGIMVEVPSIAMVSELAAAECDFASIGTNDLCQYLFAVDRMNPKASGWYQSYSAPLFRMIQRIVADFNAQGKPISVCGELGGDALAAPVLVGLGLRKLSMGAGSVAKVKHVLAQATVTEMEQLAQTALGCATAGECEAALIQFHQAIVNR